MQHKKIILIIIGCLTSILSLFSQYPGDVIELSGSVANGGEIKACHSIVLKPGFRFEAGEGQNLILKSDATVCTPYVQEPASLPESNNYIVTVTPLDATDRVNISEYGIGIGRNVRALTSIQYYDGLGRPDQNVQQKVSPDKSDLVSHLEYDNCGRESKSWLPTPIAGNQGAFVSFDQFKPAAQSYHGDSYSYNEPVYEASPLNRISQQFGPGQGWRRDGGHSVQTDYQTNTSTLTCSLYEIQNDTLLKCKGNYGNNQLYVTQTRDESGNMLYEFKDKIGQTVLTRQINENIPHDTYYVYDDFGNLAYVLPPLAANATKNTVLSYTPQTEVINYYAYIYRYDHRNRCIAKKLPGAGWMFFVYDKADRLILSQDAEQQKKNQWVFNKYDGLGRLIISGMYTDDKSHAQLCEEINAIAVTEQRGGSYGYTWNILPRITFDKVLQVNHYDDYEHLLEQETYFRDNLSYEEKTGYDKVYIDPVCNKCSAQGLLTGTRTRLLGGNGGEIVTAIYYDDKGNIIQKKSTNHLGGIEKEYIAYTFTGQPTQRLHEHVLPAGQNLPLDGGATNKISEHYTYIYDHAGRLLETFKNGESIEKLTYNSLGQVERKEQSGVLDARYTYNIRGWTKKIQEQKTGFLQELYYEEPRSQVNGELYSYQPSYNGNISSMNWKYPGSNRISFSYSYDRLNRLGHADGMEEGTSSYIEEGFAYDLHGNIEAIERQKYQDYIELDVLEMSYTGNHLKNALRLYRYPYGSNVTFYPDRGPYPMDEFFYDSNGRLVTDLDRDICTIRYNVLNLPDTIQFSNGHAIYYTYDASGVKLKTKHVTVKPHVLQPLSRGEVANLQDAQISHVVTKDYAGNIIYENGNIDKILFPGGYTQFDQAGALLKGTDHFYNKDYLGNSRDVVRKQANATELVQRTEYFPFGTPFPDESWTGSIQPYKYNGKEFDRMHGLNYYDYGARHYDPLLGRWHVMDPLAEKYYSVSPYAYCGNNPISRIDPDGKFWWFAIPVVFGLLMESQPVNAPTLDYAANDQAMKEAWSSYNLGVATNLVPLGPAAAPAVSTKVAVREIVKQEIKSEIKGQVRKEIKNEFGSKGKPDHQAKVKELAKKAETENPGQRIVTEKKINAEGSNRRPDVQVQDPQTKKTTKVYEAERKPNSQRNIKREEEYKNLGIPYETHKVGGN